MRMSRPVMIETTERGRMCIKPDDVDSDSPTTGIVVIEKSIILNLRDDHPGPYDYRCHSGNFCCL